METMLETERTYDVPAGFGLPDLMGVAGAASVSAPTELRLDATYYDTPQLQLALRRVTLRRRAGGSDAGWHLKQPATGAARRETRVPLDDGTQPPAALVEQVAELTAGAAVAPVVRIRTRRVERQLLTADGTVLAVIADDMVSSQTFDDAVLREWRELEVELVTGTEALLDEIDGVLRGAGAAPAVTVSKLARALGDRLPSALTAAPPPAAAASPQRRETLLSGYLWRQSDAFLTHAAGARDGDPTAVHKLRVATRRLRSTLRTFRRQLDPELTAGLAEELKWLAGVLGEVRDGQVTARRFARAVADLPPELQIGPVAARLRQRLATRTGRAQEEAADALRGDRYAALREAVVALATNGEVGKARPKLLRRRARKAVVRAERRLAAADQAPVEPTTAEPSPAVASRQERLHDARKAYKRARYAVEVLAGDRRGSAGKRARRLARRLTTIQDLLGAYQDTVTSRELLRAYGMQAHLDGENGFTYGLLYAREQARGEESLARLPMARHRAGRGKARRWLE